MYSRVVASVVTFLATLSSAGLAGRDAAVQMRSDKNLELMDERNWHCHYYYYDCSYCVEDAYLPRISA